MALAITFDGVGIIDSADTVTGWARDTITAPEQWTEIKKQGNASVGFQASSKDGMGYYTSAGTYDFGSGGTHEGQHFFIWVNFSTPGTLELIATGGMYLIIGSSATNYKKFKVAAGDAQEQIGRGFGRFVLDPTKTATATVGTPDMTAVNTFGIWVDTLSAAKADNLFIDRIDVGFGLVVTGTSSALWEDIVTDDALVANKYGLLQEEVPGIFSCYGGITIGDDVGTLETVVSDDSRVIKFISQYYYTTDTGTTKAPMISDSLMGIKIVDNATNKTEFTDGIIVSPDGGRNGTSILGSDDHSTFFEADALVNAASFVKLYGTSFSGLAGIIKFHDDVDSLFYGGGVDRCEQFQPLGAAVLRNLSITGYSGTLGAMLWDEDIDIQDCTFIANTDVTNNPAAIEHPSAVGTPYDYTNLTFTGNDFDVNNTSGSAITVNKLSGSDPSTSTGSAVTFSATFLLTLTNLVDTTRVVIVNSATRVVLSDQVVTASGILTYSHSGGEVVDIMPTHVDYKIDASSIYDLTLDNADQTIKFAQADDLFYSNP